MLCNWLIFLQIQYNSESNSNMTFFGTERIDFEIHMKNVKGQDMLGE